ncbi:MAG: biotin/lipoyl-containing protein [Clostridia bacterium]|jgi:biotin carboxyl carrier protein
MRKFLIKVNGNQYDVEVEEVQGKTVSEPSVAEVKTETPKKAVPANPSVSAGSQSVKSPMPGAILKVKVAVGDAVKKGQVLVILEAMKMENEIVSPTDGKVASVNVSKGSSVNAGDLLVSID